MHVGSEPFRSDHKLRYAIISMLSMLISGLSIDIYTPSLPAVTDHFAISNGAAQFTITAYLIGFAFAQLFAGTLSDHIGRKQPIIIALAFFAALSFLIPYAHNIYELQLLRFLQGVAISFVNVPARAIISDLYEGQTFYTMMNYVTIVWAVGPIIAPAIGGYLQHYFGWYASFYFLGTYTLIVLLMSLMFLPETLKERSTVTTHRLIQIYGELLSNVNYTLGLLVLGLLYTMLILFGVVAPFLIQDIMHYNPVQFGHMALMTGFAWFMGTITNRSLIRINIAIKTKTALTVMVLITCTMLTLALKEPMTIYDIIPPTILLFFCGGLIFPNYFAQNIALFQRVAGQANGLMGSMILLIAGIGSGVGILLRSHTQTPLTFAYLVIALTCLICVHIIKHPSIKQN